jgi:hypothetical protein
MAVVGHTAAQPARCAHLVRDPTEAKIEAKIGAETEAETDAERQRRSRADGR